MKTKTIILSAALGIVLITSLISCSNYRIHSLKKQFRSDGLISSHLRYKDTGLTFTGSSLVLYQVSSTEYPHLTVQRLQIMNKPTQVKLILTNIHGSLIQYFQDTRRFAFQNKILDYNPINDFLSQPLMTLAVLGYDTLEGTITLTATRTAPNQITCDLTFKQQGRPQARFLAKFTPIHPNATVWETLIAQPIPFYLSYLSSELKTKLDDYTLSKNLPFITEGHKTPFSFLEK